MIKKRKYLEILNNILETEDDVTEHFYKYTTDSLKYYKWLSEDQREQIEGITTKLRDDCKKTLTAKAQRMQRKARDEGRFTSFL